MSAGIIHDLKRYNKQIFYKDLIASITVAVVLIPQSMAYALLAGLPPAYGLYASIIPMVIYPFFGSSRILSVGPVALIAIVTLSAVSPFAIPGTERFVQLVIFTSLLAGLIQILFSVLKLGVLANFISQPVMTGFISASGITIIISQLKYLFAITIPKSDSVFPLLGDFVSHIHETNFVSLGIGIFGISMMLALKRVNRRLPHYLITALFFGFLVYAFNLGQNGVEVVGKIPVGLPGFGWPSINFDDFMSLLPASSIVALICFIGSYSIVQTMEVRAVEGNQYIEPRKELLGLGMAKLVGAFFLAMPSTGSFTRTVINKDAGGKTGISSILTAIIVAITLLFFSSLFYFLPIPVLAAVVITSSFALINTAEAKKLYKLDKKDFWVMVATFALTITLGIVNGVLIGISLSLLTVILRNTNPHFAILGRLPGTQSYRSIVRYPEANQEVDTLIIRYDQNLFYGNILHFTKALKNLVYKQKPKLLILHLGSVNDIDSTAIESFIYLIKELRTSGVEIKITNLIGPLRDLIMNSGIYEALGEGSIFLNVSDAVNEKLYKRQSSLIQPDKID
jgi:sulfate permease, SulP family